VSDAPYSWHLVPETEQALPDAEGPETRALLQVVLPDAQTGLVRVLRAVTFSPSFTRALHDAIRAQAFSPWPGRAVYYAALRDLYRRYATTGCLLRRAVARTVGGT
jgi:hypothetical protein